MTATVNGFRTKKDLKARAIGRPIDDVAVDTSLFGSDLKTDGTVCVVGPSAYDRRWYAAIDVRGGIVVKVR